MKTKNNGEVSLKLTSPYSRLLQFRRAKNLSNQLKSVV